MVVSCQELFLRNFLGCLPGSAECPPVAPQAKGPALRRGLGRSKRLPGERRLPGIRMVLQGRYLELAGHWAAYSGVAITELRFLASNTKRPFGRENRLGNRQVAVGWLFALAMHGMNPLPDSPCFTHFLIKSPVAWGYVNRSENMTSLATRTCEHALSPVQ